MFNVTIHDQDSSSSYSLPFGAIRLPSRIQERTGWSMFVALDRHRFLLGRRGIERWTGRSYTDELGIRVRVESTKSVNPPHHFEEDATKATRERADDLEFEMRRLRSTSVPLDREPIVIGRHASCDLVVSDPQVSAFHAILVPNRTRLELLDLDSLNGTRLNSSEVSHAQFCRGRITVGTTSISFGRRQEGNATVELKSPAMIDVYDRVSRVAASDVSVMILGESGTGKDVIARRIHEESGRSGRFVAINAAAIQVSLATSELFGHVKGSYTGAVSDHLGAFREADGGTLFLDEIGDMAPQTQVELLRAVESGTVRPVGSVEAVPVNVRIVAATNKNLEQEVSRGSFREDLYHRLVVVPIEIPPLRERVDDIPLLAEHFLSNEAVPRRMTLRALEKLKAYRWPGNVRELTNTLKRAAVASDKIVLDGVDIDVQKTNVCSTPISHLLHDSIIETYKRVGSHAETAKILGLRRPVVRHHVDVWERKKKLDLL